MSRGAPRAVRAVAAALLGLLCVCAGCGQERTEPPPARDGALQVFVSIPPQAYLARRVGGANVTVHTLLQPSDNPHTFNPTPKQVSMLADADLYFRLGIGLETRLVERVSGSPGLRVVDSSRGVERRSMAEPLSHRGDDEVTRTRMDPHTWLDPLLAVRHAENMCAALAELDPARAEAYEKNLETLTRELRELHRELQGILDPVRGRKMYVFHPAYGYFADRYGLQQVPVQQAGSSPGARHLSQLIRAAREEEVRAIFYQPQFSVREVRAVAEGVGAETVPLDPLAGDYAANLKRMARTVRRALDRPAKEESDGG